MFANQLRAAITAAHRTRLPELSTALWKAYAAGGVTEPEAEELTALLEARKVTCNVASEKPPTLPARARSGSRPRTDASMSRRRSWASYGLFPHSVACRFTMGEQAALAVVAAEVVKHGRCTLYIEKIAALAGVARSTVKRALRQAHTLGIIKVEERRLTGWRNASNIVVILDPAWSAWLRTRRRGVQSNLDPARITSSRKGAEKGSPSRGGGIFAHYGTDRAAHKRDYGARNRPSG